MERYYGNLIIIGGNEDKEGECEILKEVVKKCKEKEGYLTIVTAATDYPREVGEKYSGVFEKLGCREIEIIDIKTRKDAIDNKYKKRIEESSCIFFTGGDQLKITSLIGGTVFFESLKLAFERGALIVGTSAGASCLCTTMIVSGKDEDSPRKCTIKMAPGLDIIRGVLIDQHFAQRGRYGRLLNAVAQNPEIIGIGIDENTALVIEESPIFRVIGSGAVTVVDGHTITHMNVSELSPDETLFITDVRLHVLPKGYKYDIRQRKPLLNNFKEEKNENNR
ncbi:cyanophycinase [Caloramator quimbayensis]|uniref:Cyanophycinase n=1 Tax=Caloramator quimbayensis TaxID=1147123 RepID=A0A1T4WG83_9CLOT|nr:cyanophycinase [Caloramator quimbayensis]SKA76300.1 cyanophycinase [Caloramator quimbayensis]